MNSKKTKAILFDHDGTLVDSEGCHFELWRGVLGSYGIDFSEQEYREFCAGIPTPANAIELVSRFGLAISPSELEKLKNQATRDFLSQSSFPLMPGARQAIINLYEAGFKLGIVTGASSEGLDSTVQAYELHQYISCLVSSDDVINSKPAPDCYNLALQRLDVGADESLAIEDTFNGLTAAVNAGISCLAVPNALSVQQNFDSAHLVFNNLNEVVDWILNR